MKDIKFRVWDKNRNKMGELKGIGENLSDERDGRNRITIVFDDYTQTKLYKKNRIALMQYTGLKDRHGVDVYEGDLIACYKNTNEGIACIYWDEDMKTVLVKDLGDYGGIVETIDMVDESKFVIIGNIYENPELMEVE